MVPLDQYHIGFTTRFPRAVRIRDDLDATDCLTATGSTLMLYMPRNNYLIPSFSIFRGCPGRKEEKDGG